MENHGDGLTSMPGGQDTFRQSLYPEDDRGREELQGDIVGTGQMT